MWRVQALPNGSHPGFRRGGRFFSSSEGTLLSDAELTPEIRDEPMLRVEHVPDPESTAPADLSYPADPWGPGWGDLSRAAVAEPIRCGAPRGDGKPCRATVSRKGERCHAHAEKGE